MERETFLGALAELQRTIGAEMYRQVEAELSLMEWDRRHIVLLNSKNGGSLSYLFCIKGKEKFAAFVKLGFQHFEIGVKKACKLNFNSFDFRRIPGASYLEAFPKPVWVEVFNILGMAPKMWNVKVILSRYSEQSPVKMIIDHKVNTVSMSSWILNMKFDFNIEYDNGSPLNNYRISMMTIQQVEEIYMSIY